MVEYGFGSSVAWTSVPGVPAATGGETVSTPPTPATALETASTSSGSATTRLVGAEVPDGKLLSSSFWPSVDSTSLR